MWLKNDLKKTILLVADFFEERDIPFVIIGALASTILIDMKMGHTTYGSRVTRDVDCVIGIRSWDEYVMIAQGRTVPFAPFPLAVFLKIQSYYDRRDCKDLEDLFYILINYETMEISEKRFDVAGEDSLNYDTAGAYLLGRDLKDQIQVDYQKDIEPLFEIFLESESTTLLEVAKRTRHTPDEIIALLEAFKRGLKPRS